MNFLLPLIGLIAGLIAGKWLHSPVWGLMPVSFAVIVYLVLIKRTAMPLNAIRLNSRHSVWIFLLFLGIGIFDSWYHKPMSLSETQLNHAVAAEGEIVDVKTLASGDRLIVDVFKLAYDDGNIENCRNLKIVVSTDGYSASQGDVILLPVDLEAISDNQNFRSKGYSDKLKRRGLLYRSYTEAESIQLKGCSNSMMSRASKMRDRIEILIEKSMLDRAVSEFIISILLGDKSFLSNDVRDSFNNSGVAHILALSGMHVAIIMGIILLLLFPLQLMGMRKLRYVIALALIWAYAFMTGLAPSTVRACVMTSFMVLALLTQRRNKAVNSLLASAFIIILVDPASVYDIGLQLSFLCVACILAFAGPLNTVSERYHPKWHAVTSSILVSLIATLGTWVLVSYYFKRVPLLFLPTNLLLVPLLPVFIGFSLLYIILLGFGIDFYSLAWAIDKGYAFFVATTEMMSSFGHSTIEFQATFPVVLLWLAGVLMLGFSLKRKKKLFSACIGAAMLAGSIAIIPVFKETQPDGMIFQKNISEITVALYDGYDERVAEFPRNTVSRIVHKGCEILAVDCDVDVDSILSSISIARRDSNLNNKCNKRYLILGSGVKKLKLEQIPCIAEFDKVFIHASNRKKRESAIIKEAMQLGLKQIYSLKNDGPYEVEL